MSLTFSWDFDGTLVHEHVTPLRWRPGAKELIFGLKAAGHRLILFTRRATPPAPSPNPEREVSRFWEAGEVPADVAEQWRLFDEMRDFLKVEGAWDLFEQVWPAKPRADFFVDDKAEPADLISLAAEFGIPLARRNDVQQPVR